MALTGTVTEAKLLVTAANGAVREYTIRITRSDSGPAYGSGSAGIPDGAVPGASGSTGSGGQTAGPGSGGTGDTGGASGPGGTAGTGSSGMLTGPGGSNVTIVG